MPARRKVKTHKLGIDRVKKDLRKTIAKTQKALDAGRKALKRARKMGDKKAIEANTLALQDNRWVLRNLEASFEAMDDTCVDQVLNTDPTYEC